MQNTVRDYQADKSKSTKDNSPKKINEYFSFLRQNQRFSQ